MHHFIFLRYDLVISTVVEDDPTTKVLNIGILEGIADVISSSLGTLVLRRQKALWP